MITLPDGNKWVLGSHEWEKSDISYEDATLAKLPETTVEVFIDAIVLASTNNALCMPRKLTTEFGGYWDANFSVIEVFDAVCVKTFQTPWSTVYFMPWGKIYVLYTITNDCNEAECGFSVYNSEEEFTQAALGGTVIS